MKGFYILVCLLYLLFRYKFSDCFFRFIVLVWVIDYMIILILYSIVLIIILYYISF